MESGTTLPHPLRLRGARQSTLTKVWRWALAHRAALVITGITVGGLGIRLWGLAAKSLWIDETFSIGMVQQGWGQFWHTLGGVQPNMELFYVVLKGLATVTPAAWQQGESFWRLLPALAGTATIPATYALTRRLFATPVAIGAAALVAVNEFLVEYSQQARGYTLFVLLLTLSYLALTRWIEGERRALWWFAALCVLGFLTQAFEVVFFTAQVAFVLVVALRRRLPWRGFLLALVPLLAVVALRYPIYAAHPDQVAWIQRPTTSDLFHGARQLVGGDGGIPNHVGDLLVLLVLAGIIALILWGITGLVAQVNTELSTQTTQPLPRVLPSLRALRVSSSGALDRLEAVALVVLWFVIPIAGTWVGSQVKPVWVTRYLAPCAIPACIILAAALHLLVTHLPVAIRQWGGGRGVGQVYGALLAVALLFAASPLHDYQSRPGWEDWRGAAASVTERYLPGDGMVCYDNQWGCDFGFSHYFASAGGVAHLDPAAPGAFAWATYAQPNREAIFAQAVAPVALAAYLAQHPRLWVLLGHYTAGAGDWRAGLAWLHDHAHLRSKIIFPGDIEVYLYSR